MELCKLYQAILETLDHQVLDNGSVLTAVDGEFVPTTIDGNFLILPTAERLRENDWERKVAFHPLSEQLVAGQSPVQKFLCAMISLSLTARLKSVLETLSELACDVDRHKTLNIKQVKLLRGIPDFNERTLKTLTRILERCSINGEYRLINIYQSRGGKLKGVQYARTTFIEFPIMAVFSDIIENDSPRSIFGINDISKKSFESLKGLFDVVLGDHTGYSYGSNDTVAPWFHSSMMAFSNLASHLNDMAVTLQGVSAELDELHYDISWLTQLDNLKVFSGKIPPMPHNTGERKAAVGNAANSLMAAANVVIPPTPLKTQVVEVDDAVLDAVDSKEVVVNKPAVSNGSTSSWSNTRKKLNTHTTAVTLEEDGRGGYVRANEARVIGYNADGTPILANQRHVVNQAPAAQIIGYNSDGSPIFDRPPVPTQTRQYGNYSQRFPSTHHQPQPVYHGVPVQYDVYGRPIPVQQPMQHVHAGYADAHIQHGHHQPVVQQPRLSNRQIRNSNQRW